MTWTIKHTPRGGLVLADYECPVHGRFESLVDRDDQGNPPAGVICPFDSWSPAGGDKEYATLEDADQAAVDAGYQPGQAGMETQRCAGFCPWRISAPAVHTMFVVSATQGKAEPKPHVDAMDTRLLAEGQRKRFRVQRKAVREKLRQQRVKEYLR